MQSLHVYIISRDLFELCVYWGRYIDQVAAQVLDLRHLKMTLGHVDMHDESVSSFPDSNFSEGKSNIYNKVYWGWHLQKLNNLTILEVQAETNIDWMRKRLMKLLRESKNGVLPWSLAKRLC